MDEHPHMVLSTISLASVKGAFKRANSQLVIRCKNNKTEVILNTRMPNHIQSNGKQKIRYKIDDGKTVTQNWGMSDNREALFAPQSIALAKALAEGISLRVEFKPANSSTQSVDFTLLGLKEKLGHIANACNWRYSAGKVKATAPRYTGRDYTKICQQHVKDKFSNATITFDKDYNTVIPYNGNQQAFGKAIISTDKKRQFRAFRCGIDPQYKVVNFNIDDPK
jgi:hypothetical protein